MKPNFAQFQTKAYNLLTNKHEPSFDLLENCLGSDCWIVKQNEVYHAQLGRQLTKPKYFSFIHHKLFCIPN